MRLTYWFIGLLAYTSAFCRASEIKVIPTAISKAPLKQNQGLPYIISSTESECVVEVPPTEEETFILVGVPPDGKVKCRGGEVVDQAMWIRRHRVARIRVERSNFNRKVEISWESGKGVFGPPEQTPFEDIISRHIVNYETAKNWVRSKKLEDVFTQSDVKCKLLTLQDGIYRVEYDDISSIVPELISADPRTIKIIHNGFELPIVVKGEEDGKFDRGDWFEFYASTKRGKLTYLNLYSDTNIYWLSFGSSYGARLVKESCPPENAPTPDSFQCVLHFEHDSIYRLFKNYPDTIDPWFWAEFSAAHSFYLETPAPASAGICSLKIEFRAFNPESLSHKCKLYLNNYFIGEISYPRGDWLPVEGKVYFPQPVLQFTNQLRVIPNYGSICLNSIELTYFRTYKAYNGALRFAAPFPNTYKFRIDGFVNPGIRIWKLGTAVIVDGRIMYNDSLSTYTYTFEDTSQKNTFYVAQDYILKPIDIRRKESDLRSPLNRADYIIITNQKLYDCGLSFANWKESKGFTCKVVKLQEIYDDFNFGLEDPAIIREFLRYAFEVWQLPPVYVLLLGDASYDHRNIMGFGEDIVPTRNIYDVYKVLIPSDNLHACISGDDPIPDLFIGRLPVRTIIEFNIVFDKLRRYEDEFASGGRGDWRRNLIFGSMEDPVLIEITENIIKKYVPDEFEPTRIYFPPPHQPGPSQPDLIDAINKGTPLLSYIGHSGPSEWAGGLLWREAIPGLMNVRRLPFISVLGCYNGVFDGCGEEYMGELFIKSPGGGIAYWGPTGSLYIGDKGLVEGPISAILTNPVNTPGGLGLEGIIKCFEERRTPKTVLQQILLGDPSTKIYTPQPDIKLTVIPPSLHPGDSATIFGNLDSVNNGEVVITVYTPLSVQFKKISTTAHNGLFEAGFRLPDTVEKGDGKIIAYAWVDTLDFVGMTKFSILKPNIYPIHFIPETPSRHDPVIIRAKVFDEAGIDWVRCSWGVHPPPWQIIEMELNTEGYFVTKTPIPPQPPQTKVDFKIELKNWNNELFSACSSYTVQSLPDLRLYSTPKLDGISEVSICVEIANDGEEQADSFEVAFYAIVEADTMPLGKDTLTLKGKDYESARVPWNLKQGKAFIIIDPTNRVKESDETNNRSQIYEIPVTLFNVSKELGTDGWIKSLDSRFLCSILPNSISYSTVLEIKDTLMEPAEYSSYIAKFRVQGIEPLLPANLIIFPHTFYPGLSIYRWCSDYSRWLLVSPDTFATPTKLGIFSLLLNSDTTCPTIKLNLKDDTTFRISSDTITLKIGVIISDESGIDIVDRKPTITCNETPVSESLYSYPTEQTGLHSLPLVLRKTFTLGDYVLGIIAYDFNGNRVEQKKTFHIRSTFQPVEKYCWGNYPNPVRGEQTRFYFEFTDIPDEFRMQLYTVSGRFLRAFYPKPAQKIEFSWDLTVHGKPCANGVYFYRVFAKKGEEEITRILKLAILK